MKTLLTLIFLMASSTALAGFVHPMEWKASDSNRAEVIQYIKDSVRKEYCDSGMDMCQNATLKMKEDENLEAFKKAIRATNRAVMDRVIKEHCNSGVDMCSYTTILMMYSENIPAGESGFAW